MSFPPSDAHLPEPAPGPRWDLGEALTYGWHKLQANISALVLAMLVLLVGGLMTIGVSALLQRLLLEPRTTEFDPSTGAFTTNEGSGFVAVLVVTALTSAFALVVLQVLGSGLVRGALAITEGREPTLSDMVSTERLAPVVVTSVIVGALTFAGTLLCYLPGLLVGFLTSYSLFFVVDRDLSPTEAVKASVLLVKDHLGPALAWYVVGGFAAMLGLLACGVGALVTVPLVLIGTAYTYKTLTGTPVAP